MSTNLQNSCHVFKSFYYKYISDSFGLQVSYFKSLKHKLLIGVIYIGLYAGAAEQYNFR